MKNFVTSAELVVSADALPLLESVGLATFDDYMSFAKGRHICHKRGRSVFRIVAGDKAFYLKRNRLHWVEAWKSLSRCRWPSLAARIEWENIMAVEAAGISTVPPVAMGERRCFGVETASFTLTEELYGAVPLEDIIRREWNGPLSPSQLRRKRRLIRSVAQIASSLHGQGMWHQDFYLGHFLLDQDETLYLIDLQRVKRAPRVPRRCLVKDLGQLDFSADTTGNISRADKIRFLLAYFGVRSLSLKHKTLVRRITAKSRSIARHTVKLLERRRQRGEVA